MPADAASYKLISTDGHLNEPRDVWTSRVATKHRDLVPKVESLPEGDAWVFPGYDVSLPFSWGATAGRDPADMGPWCRYEDINPGSYDPLARVSEMEQDGVDAELIFGSNYPRNYVAGCEDADLHHDMIRAYNDFMSEFCGVRPRAAGWNGAAAQPGGRGMPEGDRAGVIDARLRLLPHAAVSERRPVDQARGRAVWEAIEASGMPVSIHVGLVSGKMGRQRAESLPGTGHFYDAPLRMLQFIFGGVLDRFPDIRVPFIEVDCGWIPYFESQADDNYMRHRKASLRDSKLTRMPSEYMDQYFPAAFITDPFAVQSRHHIGVDRMLWSSDYPHITTDWPYSWKTINATFEGVPADERHAILAGTAAGVETGSAGKA